MEEIDIEEESNIKDTKNNNIKIFIIVISVIIAVIAIFAIVLIPSNDNNDNNSPTYSNSYYIGDTVTNKDNVSFRINSVTNTKQVGSGYLIEETEYNFIIISITITNNSKETITVSDCIDLYNSKNVKYEDITLLEIDYIITEDISPGLSKTFEVAFETPTKTTDEKYTASIGYSSWTLDSKRVNVILQYKDPNKNNNSSNNQETSTFYHNLNETFSIDGIEFKFTGSNNYNANSGEYDYYQVFTSLKNTSTKNKDTDDFSFTLIYQNSYEYTCVWGYDDDYIQTYSSLVPLQNLSRVIIQFKTPEDLFSQNNFENLKLKIYDNTTKQTHYVTIK